MRDPCLILATLKEATVNVVVLLKSALFFVLFIFLVGKGGRAKQTLSFISFPHIHRHICRNRQNCFRLLHHDVIYHRIQGHAQQTARDPLFYAIIIMHGLEQVDVGNRSTVEYVEL